MTDKWRIASFAFTHALQRRLDCDSGANEPDRCHRPARRRAEPAPSTAYKFRTLECFNVIA
jgi:hypothetical protein